MYPVADFELKLIASDSCKGHSFVQLTNKIEGGDYCCIDFGNGTVSSFKAIPKSTNSYSIMFSKPQIAKVLIQIHDTATGTWSEKEAVIEIPPIKENGFGILSIDQKSLELSCLGVHPNSTWVGGWNYDAGGNRIKGIGDIDGDGLDEFIITSDWGIGIFKYENASFRALLTVPRDTWFGGWRYDGTVNHGRDRILDVQNFTGNPKSEILIWSNWGMSTLEWNGATLVPSRIHANGTRFGGWLLNTSDNVYCGSGQFDNDGVKDMVIMSPWGLGIISIQNSNAIYMAPNGTRFGGWLLNTRDNTVRLIADFDGDGFDEIFITSPWGIGILKLQGGVLTSLNLYANGQNLNGYIVRNSDNFAVANQFKGTKSNQIIVSNEVGIHMLSLEGTNLTRQAFVAHGSLLKQWTLNTSNDTLVLAADFYGSGRASLLLRNAREIGIFHVNANNQFEFQESHASNTPILNINDRLNSWCLKDQDVLIGAGSFSSKGNKKDLLIKAPNKTQSIKFGSILKMKHLLTGKALHSHAMNYTHPNTSGQQQVTGYGGSDDNDLWLIKRPHGFGNDFPIGQFVKDNDVLRLEHVLTRRNLHSHTKVPSPISGQQEVTAFGNNGIGDGNDNWRIEVEGGGNWESGKKIKLIHVETSHVLHSHALSHPQFTADQQEITGFGGRDDNDWWVVSEIR